MLNKKLYNLRKKHGYTQAELAEKLGVSRQSISNWELGTALPSTTKLKKVSNLYSVPLEYLLNDEISEEVTDRFESSKEGEVETSGVSGISDSQDKESAGDNIKSKRIVTVIAIAVGVIIIFAIGIAVHNIAFDSPVSSEETTIGLEDLENDQVTIPPESGFDFN